MELGRLLRPRSIAVVGASERDDSYAGETLLNLRGAGFAGPVWGVNPNRSSAHGFDCFPSLSELPGVPDAVVVGIPAASVADVLDEAGALGCGGAVVYGAGFGEVARGVEHELRLREVALRHSLPVCGPNGNGIVAIGSGAAMWGDALAPLEPGPVALVSQSGNVAVNALAGRRALRFHTVVSCGNATVVDPAEWTLELARDDEVQLDRPLPRGRRRRRALVRGPGGVRRARRGRGGAEGGRVHRGRGRRDRAHRRAGRRPARVQSPCGGGGRGLGGRPARPAGACEGARGAPRAGARPAGQTLNHPPKRVRPLWQAHRDSHLLRRRLGARRRRVRADRSDASPVLAETAARLRDLLPDAATVGNPLDYTALIWGDTERLRDIVVAVGEDPSIDRILVFYDQAADSGRGGSWAAVRKGIAHGAAASATPVMVSSTLPELLDEASALEFMDAGVPAVAGLRTGLACAAALGKLPADAAHLRAIAAAARGVRPSTNGRRWLAEHEAKELLRSAGLPAVEGRLVESEDDAVVALSELGSHVAVKISAPSVQHKADLGALELSVSTEEAVRAAYRRLTELGVEPAGILVERMAPAGVELLVSARSDAVVPCLVIALGGAWTELLDDSAIVPLPATPERVEEAIRGLRAAPVLTGGRGGVPVDVPAAARMAAAAGELLLANRLELLELNPVLVHERGATAVDAVAAG